MNRSSLIHYIDPSAIGITPNVNNSANDLEVYIAQGCKIQVYCPRAGLDYVDGKPQEWTLKGRNRRLVPPESGDCPYTVYARLNMQDKGDGYLVFAPKQYLGEKWVDKYVYVTPEGLTKQGYDPDTQEWWPTNRSFQYWYFKLGDVSLPENGERTVDIDTGLLGTEEFNNKWALNPDSLPLRIEFQSTIADEQQPPVTRDGGTTPYVYWGETLTLTALLTEGWTGTDIQRFDHWEIMRDSGDAQADAAWNAVDRSETFGQTGIIALIHGRGAETRDDFNSAVNTTFTVKAMERVEETTGDAAATVTEEPEYAILKQASFCIMAEVWEDYQLSADTLMVTFNPRNGQYSPSGNIKFRIRATDQKSEVFMMTYGQYAAAGLHAEYAPIDNSQNWTPITISGSESATAEGEVPATAFSTNQKSINVRLKNAAGKELDRFTIAFLKDGEDSREREWIYRLDTAAGYSNTTGTIGGDPSHPVSGQTGGIDNCRLVDDFVPENWTDEPTGTSSSHDTEYTSYRDYDHDNNRWGAFNVPTPWSHYGQDGDDGLYYVYDYKRFDSRAANPSTGAPTGNTDMQSWADTAPAPTETYKYIWKRSRLYNPNTQQYGTASYTCETGEDGPEGPAGDNAPYYVVDYGRASSRSLNQQGTPSGFDSTTGWQNTAPVTTDTYKYIWERSRYYNSAGTLQSTSYTCLTGAAGPDGDDGISVVTDPTNILIRQVAKPQGNTDTDFGLPMDVGFTVKEGGSTGTVTNVYINSVQGLTVIRNNDDHTKARITNVVPTGTVYPDKGYFTCTVYYTINGTNKNVQVKVPVYIDLMGSIVTTIEGDVERTVAHDIGYAIDPSGGIESLQQVGTYIRSASEMTSVLSKKVGEGKNLLTGVLTGEGWQLLHNGTKTNIETDDEDKFVIPSGDYLESPERNYSANDGYYALSYEAPAYATIGFYDSDNNPIDVPWTRGYVNGRRYIIFNTVWEDEGEEYSLDTDAVIRFSGVSYIRHPQLETGEVATAFEAGSTETTSRIHQTAEQIDQSVRDDLGTVGVIINGPNKSIRAIGEKFSWENNNGDIILGLDNDGNGTFAGTVRAKNFYHNSCIFTEGSSGSLPGYSYSRYYCTSAPEGYSFQQGEYYTAEEIIAEIGTIPYQNFAQCVYDADVVHMIPRSGSVSGANWGPDIIDAKKTVTLPDPADFEGKIIEVYCDYYGDRSAGAAYIDCVQPNSFASHMHLGTDGHTLSVSWQANREIVEGGVTVRFRSIEAYYDQTGETMHRWLIMGTSYDYPILEQLLQAHFDNRYQRLP